MVDREQATPGGRHRNAARAGIAGSPHDPPRHLLRRTADCASQLSEGVMLNGAARDAIGTPGDAIETRTARVVTRG